MTVDLRHIALILDTGSKAAYDIGDAALGHTLGHMTEVAVAYHLEAAGLDDLFNVTDDFNKLAERFQ